MQVFRLAIAVTCAGLFALGQASASPIPTLFGTGVDALGNPLPGGSLDPHYTVSPGTNAYTIGLPGSVGWVGNTAHSSWISNVANTYGGPGPFTYTTTFDLTGFNPSTALITGQMSADDQAVVYLNGVDVFHGALDPTAPWSFLEPLTISSGFVAGLNMLEIVIPNYLEYGNDGPTGLQLDIVGTADPVERNPGVPEPATIALLGIGLAGLGSLRRRRK
jgi:hypothetical protein